MRSWRVAIDLGQGGEHMELVRQRALDCGAVEAVVIDARDEFANEYCLPAIQSNALYMDRYPLVSALSRPLIVKHLVVAARQYGGDVVAHGCTGKGNDQVRFEVRIRFVGTGSGGAGTGPRLRMDAGEGDRLRRRERDPRSLRGLDGISGLLYLQTPAHPRHLLDCKPLSSDAAINARGVSGSIISSQPTCLIYTSTRRESSAAASTSLPHGGSGRSQEFRFAALASKAIPQ